MDAVAEVKDRLNIEDVIGEYVQLKRAGRNYKGLSPFTNEKTPSFMVSPEKQIWHDFSSGKGGDIFTFVMEVEGLEFKAALETLARRAGVELEQFSSPRTKTNAEFKKRALETLELSAKFYQKQLIANKSALNYLLKERKFNRQTILTWRLGYAPNTGKALSDFLTKNGYETPEMKRAGLVFDRRTSGVGDMFRGRIIIPLTDAQGAIVGFTGRLLVDDPDAPKYINTPQTITYDKGRQVFGLHLAKESIRKKGYVVVVEGNMDVIASHQAGINNVVASAGTAMTEMHMRELKRFTGDVRLCFDADKAGIAATERVIPLSQKVDVHMNIIDIKDAKDPDELIQKDPKQWQKAIGEAVYAPDWLIGRYHSQLDLSSATGKKAFTDALLITIKRLRDPVEQEHYLKEIAKLTETSLAAVKDKMAGRKTVEQTLRRRTIKISGKSINREEVEYQKLQDHLLAMTLMQPKIRDLLKDIGSTLFNEGPRRNLLEFLKTHLDFKGEPLLAKQLQSHADYVKIIMLQFEELYHDLPLDDLREQADNLKHRLIDRFVKTQKRQLAAKMESIEDEAELRKLVAKADKLNQLIKYPGREV
ncbi:MAG TPA: DNA primase [Nitrososphaera sp.]|jgi:DNA primase|nr:DNA primase [Nitrososphaera sp.]